MSAVQSACDQINLVGCPSDVNCLRQQRLAWRLLSPSQRAYIDADAASP